MAGRPVPKSSIKPVPSNKQTALELVTAALQGGLARRSTTTSSESQDSSSSQARMDAYYIADLLHHVTVRLDRRDSQD